jgi:hypothetical protein
MFHVGQKVVCVDDERRVAYRKPGLFARFRKFELLAHNLNAEEVYKVAAVSIVRDVLTQREWTCLHVIGAWHFGHRWVPFPSFQFSPVIERETDISIFTAMLSPKKQGVEA